MQDYKSDNFSQNTPVLIHVTYYLCIGGAATT